MQSRTRSQGLGLLTRVERCMKAIWNWGKGFARNFSNIIEYWKCKMENSISKRDRFGLNAFAKAQSQYLRALDHQNSYWKQRSKELWLKEGDANSHFFHNYVRMRRRNNRISRFKKLGWSVGGKRSRIG